VGGIFKTEEGRAAVHARYRELLAHWPVANQQLRLATGEGETFVVASGPTDAPALVLLHGAQASALTWMGDVTAWSQHFRVFAVDVIGDVGLSAPSRPKLDTDGYARWLDDVLAGLGVERAALVGLSLGGFVALDYAIRRPAKVTALALLCSAGIGRQKNLLARAFPLLFLGAWGRRKLREMVFGPTPENPSPTLQAFGGFFALIHQHAKRRMVRIPVASDAALAGLAMPVMAVVGGRDVLIDSAETRRRLERHVARAEVHVLPDAYHLLPSQTESVLAFLRRVGGAAL
jgi:pimeloyl-ACP methyl ester carboxylesterase